MTWLINLLCWAYVNIGMIKKFWNVMEGSVQLFTMGEIRWMFNFMITWFYLNWNLCWSFHYISELFNYTNVHISSTEDVRLMPKKICETFRKSTRHNGQMKKLNIHLISPIVNYCTEPSITFQNVLIIPMHNGPN